jgi:hypothetical protein
MPPSPPRPESVLPPGTRVVARVEVREHGSLLHASGAVGIIVVSPVDPQHAYRVRFPGGHEVALSRRELAVLSGVKTRESGVLESAMDEADLRRYVVYEWWSAAAPYGLEHEGSDTDVRTHRRPRASTGRSPGSPAARGLRAAGVLLGARQASSCAQGQQACSSAWTPLVVRTRLAPIRQRSIFLSKLVHRTFGGYAISPLRKLLVDLERGAAKPKHAMHLLRLLITGAAILREATVPVRVAPEHREGLLAVRDGTMPWPAIEAWRRSLHADATGRSRAAPTRAPHSTVRTALIDARRRRRAARGRADPTPDGRPPSRAIPTRPVRHRRGAPLRLPEPRLDADLRGVHVCRPRPPPDRPAQGDARPT